MEPVLDLPPQFTNKEVVIGFGMILMSLVGIGPAIKNFKYVLEARHLHPTGRMLTLAWMGLGIVCLIFVFGVFAYLMKIRWYDYL